jgi:hypothetical protein
MIRTLTLLFSAALSANIFADEYKLPPEVDDYIHERNLCEHFRGEPHEGNSPEQIERRKFIFESLEIYCAGTDRRLAALKRRYKDNPVVIEKLSIYEVQAEGSAK